MALNRAKKLKDRINGTFVRQLEESQFFKNEFLASLKEFFEGLDKRRDIHSIICYGLGSFCSGVDIASRYQLALLILTYQHLVELGAHLTDYIEVFDPSFESLDKITLLSFSSPKFKLIDTNEYCARCLEYQDEDHPKVTLVYMPHLDKYFYNNLLGANWSRRGLNSLAVLGNSFQEMIENEILKSKRESELYYLNLLVNCFMKSPRLRQIGNEADIDQGEALIEIKIDDSCFEHSDIFNSLSFHVIDDIWIQKNFTKICQYRLKNWHRLECPLNEDQGEFEPID